MYSINSIIKATLAVSAIWAMNSSAIAEYFNVPQGTLSAALDVYVAQSGIQIAVSSQALKGVQSKGVSGDMSPERALAEILAGTGFTTHQAGNSVAIVRVSPAHAERGYNSLTKYPTVRSGRPSDFS